VAESENPPNFAADFPRRLEELDDRLTSLRDRLGAVTERLDTGGERRRPDVAPLLFVPSPTGYELVDADGAVPAIGEPVELPGRGDRRYVAVKVARSPLPGDDRACVFVEPD
jgi:hypothetical protein